MEIIHAQKTPTNNYSENKRLEAMVWVNYACTPIPAGWDGEITLKVQDLKTITGFFVQSKTAGSTSTIANEALIVTVSGNTIKVKGSSPSNDLFEEHQVNIFVTGR